MRTTALRVLGGVVATVVLLGATPAAAQATFKRPPTVTVLISDDVFDVRGATRPGTGPISFSVNASVEGGGELTIFRKKARYSMAKLRHDFDVLAAAQRGEPSHALAAMQRIEHNVTVYGGAGVINGGPVTTTVVLAPGTYFLGDNTSSAFGRLKTITVTDKPNGGRMPRPKATVAMTADKRFTGDAQLPHLGTIEISNVLPSGSRWYSADLYQVRKGTKAKDVREALRHPNTDPAFLTGAGVGGGMLSPGKQEFLNYRVAPGRYLLLCGLMDLDRSGHSYAEAGMFRLITMV
jgi:hypothetical protein